MYQTSTHSLYDDYLPLTTYYLLLTAYSLFLTACSSLLQVPYVPNFNSLTGSVVELFELAFMGDPIKVWL